MKLPPKGTKTAVRLVYWGRDNGPEFDLLIDGTVIATAKLQGTGKEDYYGVEYPVARQTVSRQGQGDRAGPGQTGQTRRLRL